MKEANLLFNDKGKPESITKACKLYAEFLSTHENNFEACWKLSRAISFLGEFYPEHAWKDMYSSPLKYAEKSVQIEPLRPEGHLWLGIMLGRDGQDKGIMKSLKNLSRMKIALQISIDIDKTLENGLALRAMGRLYFTLPKIVGGNYEISLRYLYQSLEIVKNPITIYYLSDTYQAMGHHAKSNEYLEDLINLDNSTNLPFETNYYKEKARKKISELNLAN
ncbi:MAG: hypothetical protein IPM71_14220 [Bacteroidota bacterium]|nr:MAG: hypothetical protein IPM71_14220 [Bacteroidota bacterium]